MSSPSQMTTATVRTAVQSTILSAVVAAVFKLTGWSLEVDDLLPYVPVMLPIAAVVYRASRAVGDKWPAVGYVLFGIPPPPCVPASGPRPPSGWVTAERIFVVVAVVGIAVTVWAAVTLGLINI